MERRQMLNCLLASGLSAMWGVPLFAQQGAVRPQTPQSTPPRVANANGGAPRPNPESMGVDRQKLDAILQEWEQKTTSIKRLRGEHQRYEYDSVFAVEKRSVGEFWHEAPDKGRINLNAPAQLPDPPVNTRVKTKEGRPYRIEAEDPATWICDGKNILQIDHTPKTYGVAEIPPQFQGENIMNGPLPFLFGMQADRIKERYGLSFGDKHEKQMGGRKIYHLIATPLTQNDARNWKQAEVLLDAEMCLPSAIKLLDPAGSKQTVYVFSPLKMKINERWWIDDPFKLSLRGYKLVRQEVAPPPNPQNGGAGRAVQPVGGTKGD